MSASTQIRHPWRATARTIFAYAVAIATVWPLIVQALGLDQTWLWVSVSLAVAGGLTRIMAIPAVDTLLAKIGLSAQPGGTAANMRGDP